MEQYHLLLKHILEHGETRDDRTGVGTKSIFGHQLSFDLSSDFPAVTTKKLAFNACKAELLWFLEGSGDERRLAEITHGTRDGTVTIWTPNALAPYWKNRAQFEGDLGRVYGVQWRHWNKYVQRKNLGPSYLSGTRLAVDQTQIDQIDNLITGLIDDPYSRRHIISAWNVGELDQMALPPCHVMSQFYVSGDKKLSCHMYQRSVDVFLGLPFNIASYALLTHLVAQVCNFSVGNLIISMGDAHIYKSHIDQAQEQLTREHFPAPTLWINPQIRNIHKFAMDDIKLVNYKYHPPLVAPMAV